MFKDLQVFILIVGIIALAALVTVFAIFFPQQIQFPAMYGRIFSFLSFLSPIWMPVLLGLMFWRVWTDYTLADFIFKTPHTLLEIKLPPEVTKSPQAAELMLVTLHQTSGETTVIDRYWFGKRRMWFSLEMVSIDGNIHFFIWTRTFWKNAVEAAIYAQYPEAEVYEVPDYTLRVMFDPKKMSLWGVEFKLTKEDPYPIKTYVDYGLDKADLKEEYKVDPLTPLLEYLGSCHRDGQIWIQILIQAHKKGDKKKKGSLFGKADWREEAGYLVDKILKRDPKTKGPALSEAGFPIIPTLSEGEKRQVEAIERSISKLAFNVGIRGIYMAKKEAFNPINIVGLIGCLKQFNSMELNGFSGTRWHIYFDWPWQDYKNIRANRYSRLVLEYYKRRAYFHPPYKQTPMILTTEEVATLFHLPGRVATTPTLGRILSKKAEAPPNLPV
jgi:hypothetical protein